MFVFQVLELVSLVSSWSFHETLVIAEEAYEARNMTSAWKPVKN